MSNQKARAEVRIERLAFGGAGVGRWPDGRVCFVRGGLPGEHITAVTTRVRKSYIEAEVETIHEPAPERVTPRCPVFGRCGGCAYQHLEYASQLEWKRRQVEDQIRRIARLDTPVAPVKPSPMEWNYRNRIAVHVEAGHIGFRHRASATIVDVGECAIASPAVNERLSELRNEAPRGPARITLRDGTHGPGFSQVNDGAAAVLAETVSAACEVGGDFLVDAYCGSGFFAKHLRPLFRSVAGIEWSERAVGHALASAGEGERYFAGSVEEHLPALLAESHADVTLLLDPPAEGLAPEVLNTIRARPPARLIYVSCDPATLARDLARLNTVFSIERIEPVDMFPQTAEIEIVSVAARR